MYRQRHRILLPTLEEEFSRHHPPCMVCRTAQNVTGDLPSVSQSNRDLPLRRVKLLTEVDTNAEVDVKLRQLCLANR